MGFYGNITDAARTQFQFDIIYASRKEMDQHATNDGVYMGRFVLVNYENQYLEPLSQEEETFYEGQEPSLYTINFNRDKQIYGSDRGYDSTVWQKVYTNNVEKYIMIAELNTITPIFEIGEADAPRMVPLTPHFGEDSTNIYYKLHWSPTWGLRVKAANPGLQGNILTSEGFSESQLTSMSTDSHQYLSDEETKWYKTVNNNGQTSDYVFVATGNPDIGAWDNATNADNRQGIPAAIYYNKDGFNPAVSSYGYRELTNADTYAINRFYKKVDGQYVLSSDPAMNPGTTYYEKIENHIKVEPSGKSGHVYNQEDNDSQTPGLTPQVDTQEISIMLPGIGDAIAAVWDLIYGSEEINGSINRNLDISWESGRDVIPRRGLRLITDFEVNNNEVDNTEGYYRYQTKNVETIAGAINSVHDLMGMIIVPTIPDDYNLLNENKIYYDENTGTFNRKKLYYHYETIDDNNLDIYNYEAITVTNDTYEPNLYFFKNNQNEYEPATGDYINQQYYIRTLIPDGAYTEVPNYSSYINFNGANYAYADYFGVNGFYDYIRSPKYDNSKEYYTWSSVVDAMEQHDVSGEYESNRYYIRDAIGNFVLDTNPTPQNKMHYRLVPSNIQTLSQISSMYDGIYMPDTYAFKITEGDNSYFAIDSSPDMSSKRDYYRLQVSPRTDTESIYIKVNHFVEISLTEATYVANTYYTYNSTSGEYLLCTDPSFDERKQYYYETTVYKKVDNNTEQFTVDTTKKLTLLQFHTNEFYRKDGNNYMVITPSSNIDFAQASQIYTLRKDTIRQTGEPNGGTYILNDVDFGNENESAMIEITNDFYQANRYYYEADNGNYTSFILDTHTVRLDNTNYYVLDPNRLIVADNLTNVFEPNKYYIKKADDVYELVTTATNPQVPFYIRNDLCYVIDDTEHIFKHGAIWNYGIQYVPASITLATRTESYGLEPLEGFARDITTMHGLILKIKALLNDGDKDTRDTSTVQGALNVLNDKLAQLENWKSGQVFIIDDYGRLHGAELIGEDGISVEVDSNINNPKVTFSANFDGVKLRNYELDEENTGDIEAMDSLEVALNKVENTAIGQQEQFDDLVNWTETVTETTPGSETEIGLARAEFWTLYTQLNRSPKYIDGVDKIVRVDPLPGISINDSRSFMNAKTAIAEANNVAGIGMYYYNDNTGEIISALTYAGSYDYYCLYDYALNYLLQVNNQYPTFYEQGQSYRDPDVINEIEVPHTIENLVEDFPTANFTYELQPEILLNDQLQNYWQNYLNEITRTTYKLDTFSYYQAYGQLTAEEFDNNGMPAVWRYNSVKPLGPSDTSGSGSPTLTWNFYNNTLYIRGASVYNSNYYYYQQSDNHANIYLDFPINNDGFISIRKSGITSAEILEALYFRYLGEIYYIEQDQSNNEYIKMNYTYQKNYFVEFYNNINHYTFYISTKGYLKSDHINKYNTTSQASCIYIFKPISLTAETYASNTYYLQKDDNIYILSRGTFDLTQTYYKLQESPFKEQEHKAVTTSLATLWDTFFPIGSTYTTTTNNPPTFGGEWTLIHKGFKETIFRSSDYERGFPEPISIIDTDLVDENSNFIYHIFRGTDSINIRMAWKTKVALGETNYDLFNLDFGMIGIELNGAWASRGLAYSDTLNAFYYMLITAQENQNFGIIRYLDYAGHDVSSSTGVVVEMQLTLLFNPEMKKDKACDKFTWKRIS